MTTSERIERLNKLVAQAGSQQDAADLVKQETGFAMPQSTISRLCRGEGKPAMFHLVAYALENALNKAAK